MTQEILPYAKAMLVEEIMILIGRASPDPVRYRRLPEDMEIETLSRLRDELLDGPPLSLLPPVESPFPAVSLTDNAGEIASADIGTTMPDSSRESFSTTDKH